MSRAWFEPVAALVCAALAIGATTAVAKYGNQDLRRRIDMVVYPTARGIWVSDSPW